MDGMDEMDEDGIVGMPQNKQVASKVEQKMKTRLKWIMVALTIFVAGVATAGDKAPARLSADFTMKRTLAVLEDTLESTGRIAIGGKGLLRWETLAPNKSTLIINGQRAWIHYPEFDMVKDFDLGNDPVMKVMSSHLLSLTSGDFDNIADLYVVEDLEGGKKRLLPKEDAVKKVFQEMRVLMTEKGVAKQVEIVSQGGDVTAIEFRNVLINPDLPAELFTKPKQ